MESPGIEMQNLIPSRRSSCNASEASIPRLGTNQLQQSPSGGQYAPLHPRDPQTPLKTSETFDGAGQTRRLLFKRTLRWIGTVIFTALIIATLNIYEGKGNFSSDQKTVFNTIVVALILGLGLNLFVSRNPAKAKRTTYDRLSTVAYYLAGSIQRISKSLTMEDPGGRDPHRARDRLNLGYRELAERVCACMGIRH